MHPTSLSVCVYLSVSLWLCQSVHLWLSDSRVSVCLSDFQSQTLSVCLKMSKQNGQLSKLMKMLANATIMSYGAHVYANDAWQVNRIQVKLNKTMSMMTSSKLKVHVKNLLEMMHWMKFSEVLQLTKIMLLSQIVKKLNYVNSLIMI